MRNIIFNSFIKPELNLTLIFMIFDILLITKKKNQEDNVSFSMSKFEKLHIVKRGIELPKKDIKNNNDNRKIIQDFLLNF
jgi:hypothetical protein